MIMRPGQQLLLPANPFFIAFTVAAALGVNMFSNEVLWGRAAWAPDVLALVLVFWVVHQPRYVGVGVAFALGLLMDVHQGSLLGQHALAYTVLGYLSVMIHRRLLWFSVPAQALHIWPILLLTHLLEVAVRMLVGGNFPGAWVLLASAMESVLWPVVSVMLLAPQRRAPNPDAHRPL